MFLTLIGVDDIGDYNERLHVVLVPVFRAGFGPSVHEPPNGLSCDSAMVVFAFLVARLRQQFSQSSHLRDDQQRLPAALPRDPLSAMQVTQQRHEGRFLSIAVRQRGQQNGTCPGRWRQPVVCHRLSLIIPSQSLNISCHPMV